MVNRSNMGEDMVGAYESLAWWLMWGPVIFLIWVACQVGLVRFIYHWGKPTFKQLFISRILAYLAILMNLCTGVLIILGEVEERHRDRLFAASMQVLPTEQVVNGIKMPAGTKLQIDVPEKLDKIDLTTFSEAEFPQPVNWNGIDVISLLIQTEYVRTELPKGKPTEIENWLCAPEQSAYWKNKTAEKLSGKEKYQFLSCTLVPLEWTFDFPYKGSKVETDLVEKNIRDDVPWKLSFDSYTTSKYDPLLSFYGSIYLDKNKRTVAIDGYMHLKNLNAQCEPLSSSFIWFPDKSDIIYIRSDEDKSIPDDCYFRKVVKVSDEEWKKVEGKFKDS